MRARMGLGKPLEGYSLGAEGREPRPQNLGNINDFQTFKPEGWAPRPQDLGSVMDQSMGAPKPEQWAPHPMPEGGPTDYAGWLQKPEGRTPKPQQSPIMSRMGMKSPWQPY